MHSRISIGVFLFLVILCVLPSPQAQGYKALLPDSVVKKLPKKTQQLVIIDPLESFQAQLTTWQLQDGRWEVVTGLPMLAVVGRNGFAPQGEKREGDGRTPSGIYRLGTAFGYAPSINTKLNYRQATDNDLWIDDPQSPQYNQWVMAPTEAKSFEKMRRDDNLYKYGVVIEYNTDPVVPGHGSAIFLHVGRGPDQPTAGCVATSEDNVNTILKWLDKDAHPMIILGSIE